MNPATIREYYQLIKNKIQLAHFETALHTIDKLLDVNPKDEHAYYYKGVCSFALENYKQATKCYSIAIQLNPAHAKAYFNLGVTLYISRQFDLALVNFAKALIIFTKQKELDKKQRAMDAIKLIEKERNAY